MSGGHLAVSNIVIGCRLCQPADPIDEVLAFGKLNAAVNAGIASPETLARLARMGAALIAAETPKWAAVMKAAGIRIE